MNGELLLLKEPVRCPLCDDAGRVGFLMRVYDADQAEMIINSKNVVFECSVCHALFGVENE